MHAQDGHACVQGGNVAVGHIHGHGAAAAGIHLAQLRNVPEDIRLVQHPADIGHRLRRSIGGTGLAPGAGILAQAHAVVDEGGVALFKDLGEVGVVGRRHIAGEAEGVFIAGPQGDTLAVAQVVQEGVEGGGLHTRDAHGADLLLVGQHTHGGLFRLCQLQNPLQGRKAADTVIVAVGSDEAGVQADVRGRGGRDGLQLGGGEIVLGDAVLLIELFQNLHLHPVLLVLLAGGAGAQENIQALAGDGLVERLFPLLAAQMGQQVRDDKLGLLVLAQPYLHHGAVLLGHHAVKLQGDGDPLVLADAAVVMGLEKGQLTVLVQGVGLQVQAGGVDMGGHDLGALFQALLAYDSQHDALAPVYAIDTVAGL